MTPCRQPHLPDHWKLRQTQPQRLHHHHPQQQRHPPHHPHHHHHRHGWLFVVCTTLTVWSLLLIRSALASKAILGVDLGSLYMKVALVQRGAPLEIVTNLHAKRKTEQMILLDQDGSRFYGADAYSLLARKPTKTPSAMTLLLGRNVNHPAVKVLVDRYHSILPYYNETRHGLALSVEGGYSFTPEELVAMMLHHAKEITIAFAAAQGNAILAQDVVLTVPSFATQAERQAWLDAAHLADLNVLALLDENTAAALHFGMDKMYTNSSKLILFYNMGASSLQVSLVKFDTYEIPESKLSKKTKTVGALQVLAKAWDMTLGGDAFDHRLVEHMADQFNHQLKHKDSSSGTHHHKDIRTNARAMMKLRLQASKVKHVLSANTEFPVFLEGLHEDVNFATVITRTHLEEWCADLIQRAIAPVRQVLEQANVTVDQVDAMELIGGGMRIPKIQTALEETLKVELGMHINSDESMALGAAFHGANISTAFRVRHVGLTDIYPYGIAVQLNDMAVAEQEEEDDSTTGSGLFGLGGKKKKADDAVASDNNAAATSEEPWSKRATLFKANGKLGVKKTIAFTHDRDVACALDYEEADILPNEVERSIVRYNVTGVADFAKEMAAKGLGKPKVSLQFELNPSGLTRLIKAEAALEETVIVQQEVEVQEDADVTDAGNSTAANATGDNNNATESTTARKAQESNKNDKKEKDKKKDKNKKKEKNETTKDTAKADDANNTTSNNETTKSDVNSTSNETEAPKKKTILVDKEVKKMHRRTLLVSSYHVTSVRPYSAQLLQESRIKLQELERRDKERILLEEARNKVESYIYQIKNRLVDHEEEIAKVSTEEQRSEISKLADDAEDWMYGDGAKADLAAMLAKYSELSTPAEKIFLRWSEQTARPEAILALHSKLTKVEEVVVKKLKTTMPHVTAEEWAEVQAKIDAIRQWIVTQEAAQAKLLPTDEPAFLSSDVPLQAKPLEGLLARLSRKPKPKPKVEKKNQTKSNNSAGNATADNSTTMTGTANNETNTNTTNDEGTNTTTSTGPQGDDEL